MGKLKDLEKPRYREELDFDSLLGYTISEVELDQGKGVITLKLAPHDDIPDGLTLKMLHMQSCCEEVYVDDIAGNWLDVVGSPLTLAEEVTQSNGDDGAEPRIDPDWPEYKDHSYTWTFYKLGTAKGYVTIKWYGTSNGWYSEEVSLVRDWKK